jgi:putative ABC transport system permease protein
MNLREGVRIALAMIRANKLRAFFTVLGTVFGVTFLIAVLTVINGMDVYMKEDFAGKIVGYNTVTLRRRPQVTGDVDDATWRAWARRPRLTVDDAEYVAERMEVPGKLTYFSDGDGKVSDGAGRVVNGVRLVGSSPSYFEVRDVEMEDGRAFSEMEARTGTPVVVLGKEVAEQLFDDRSPIGRTVRIHNFPFRVIGVIEEQGTLFGFSLDKQAFAPYRSQFNGSAYRYNEAEDVSFQVPDGSLLPAATAQIEGLMRVRRRLSPQDPNSFDLETAESALEFWNTISSFMLKVLPGLVGISLVVGAVVIMNIMLVSVTERTREIGVRKSLGARRRDILLQFLIESATLSGVGGVVGIGFGVALAWLVTAVTPMPASVSGLSVVLSVFLSIGVGLVAGVYPAWRAAKLDPIVALRSE